MHKLRVDWHCICGIYYTCSFENYVGKCRRYAMNKQKTAIIMDSGGDIPREDCEECGIRILPLHVIYPEKDYLDGIDIDRSRNVTIKNCRIDTADDCLTLRASSAHLLVKPMDCSDIQVSACILSSDCNAVRVGVGEGFIHDAVFSDLSIVNSNVAFNLVAAYEKGSRGTDIARIQFRNVRLQAKEFLRIHHMYSKNAQIYDITFDTVEGAAPNCSHIWAKKAAPFSNILLHKVFVPAEFECVNATVLVEGGQMMKKNLSQEELRRLGDAIENETQLLY